MNQSHANNFLNYFKKELIFKTKIKEKYELLHFMSEAATSVIDLPDGFYDAVYKREMMGHTSFGNGICIPHPIRPMGNESFVAIAVLEKPIIWEYEVEVRVVFLLSMKESGDDKLQEFYKIMSRIISNKKYIDKLIMHDSFEDFCVLIREIISSID